MNDLELWNLYKLEDGVVYSFSLSKGETLDMAVDETALSIDDIKHF